MDSSAEKICSTIIESFTAGDPGLLLQGTHFMNKTLILQILQSRQLKTIRQKRTIVRYLHSEYPKYTINAQKCHNNNLKAIFFLNHRTLHFFFLQNCLLMKFLITQILLHISLLLILCHIYLLTISRPVNIFSPL